MFHPIVEEELALLAEAATFLAENPEPPAVDGSITKYVSKWIVQENLDVGDIVQGIYDRINEQYGTDEDPSQ